MMNGIVIRRGKEYLARKSKKARMDEDGMYWSGDSQKARIYMDYDKACRTANRIGGTVELMQNGRVED